MVYPVEVSNRRWSISEIHIQVELACFILPIACNLWSTWNGKSRAPIPPSKEPEIRILTWWTWWVDSEDAIVRMFIFLLEKPWCLSINDQVHKDSFSILWKNFISWHTELCLLDEANRRIPLKAQREKYLLETRKIKKKKRGINESLSGITSKQSQKELFSISM